MSVLLRVTTKGQNCVDDQFYDYSLDIWSLGCMLAGMIFKKEPFFCGADNVDQLVKIMKVLGSEQLDEYLDTYELDLDVDVQQAVDANKCERREWASFTNKDNKERVCPEVIDLIDKMLVYDPVKRILPKEAMDHAFFAKVKKTNE